MSATDTINITNLIDSRPISKYQASVFFLCALAALMDGFDSVIIGITAPAIAKTLGLDVKTFGPVFSAAQFGFMLGAFIAGPLADRYGRKSILILSVVVFGIFSLLTPLSGSYEQLVALRFLTGLTLGGASTGLVALVAASHPTSIRSTGVGWAIGMSRSVQRSAPSLPGSCSHLAGRFMPFSDPWAFLC